MEKKVWIGLFSLKVEGGNTILPSCTHAYVNALTVAEDMNEFISSVEAACKDLKFLVEEFEDVKQLPLCDASLSEEILSLVKEAKNSNQVEFTTFHGAE